MGMPHLMYATVIKCIFRVLAKERSRIILLLAPPGELLQFIQFVNVHRIRSLSLSYTSTCSSTIIEHLSFAIYDIRTNGTYYLFNKFARILIERGKQEKKNSIGQQGCHVCDEGVNNAILLVYDKRTVTSRPSWAPGGGGEGVRPKTVRCGRDRDVNMTGASDGASTFLADRKVAADALKSISRATITAPPTTRLQNAKRRLSSCSLVTWDKFFEQAARIVAERNRATLDHAVYCQTDWATRFGQLDDMVRNVLDV